MKNTHAPCAFVILADGFEEVESIVVLSLLREAGWCAKSISLVSGLVSSAHGLWIMPDLTLADLDQLNHPFCISAVILPSGQHSLTKMEADPRVHQLLRQVVAKRGHIITSRDGLRVVRAAAVWGDEPRNIQADPLMAVILRKPEESPEVFVQNLVRRLKQPLRA
jgi:hypothetical protein